MPRSAPSPFAPSAAPLPSRASRGALDKVEASYADGVLTITIPVAEAAKARKIAVAHRPGQHAIEGEVEPDAGVAGTTDVPDEAAPDQQEPWAPTAGEGQEGQEGQGQES